ncbi:MFS general substrate transporter [Colletotrichum falcatum]|nr:MFS general substrate transporter [Colletotrichum falcatum]
MRSARVREQQPGPAWSVGGLTAPQRRDDVVMGRLLTGFAVGTTTGVAPVFGAEIAKTHERARITAVNQMMVSWGFFVALWTGVGEGKWHSPDQWRLGFAMQSLPALLLGVGVLFVGESPRRLCLEGRHEGAEKAFRSYHHDGLSWGDLLRTPAFRKRLFVGAFVWGAAMLSGISFVQYYQTAIYATLRLGQDLELLVGGLYGSIGPRGILVISSSLLSVCYSTMTILAAVYPARPGFPTNDGAQRGRIACIFAVSAIYSALLGPMTWIIPPEVFTTELRAKANAIVQVVHYSISLIITQCSPIALAAVGWKYYILFILTNALCAVVFAICYPETRGKKQIDDIFGDVKVVHDADLEEKAGRPGNGTLPEGSD